MNKESCAAQVEIDPGGFSVAVSERCKSNHSSSGTVLLTGIGSNRNPNIVAASRSWRRRRIFSDVEVSILVPFSPLFEFCGLAKLTLSVVG